MPGPLGLALIRGYANGRELSPEELDTMRATMYLISLYLRPQHAWEDFKWQGPEYFIRELWPEVEERDEIISGLFSHGSVKP